VSMDLTGLRGDVTDSLAPTLLDDKGQQVNGLQFTPSTARVSLAVERQIGVKTVPLRVTTSGQVANGYWLSSLTVTPQTVTITGGPAALAQIDYIDLPPLDLNGAKADVSRTTPLQSGSGYSLTDENVSVEVKAVIQPLRTTEVLPIGVAVLGVPAGLEARLSPANVEVTIGGLVPALSALKPGDISAVVDVTGMAAGEYTLPVRLAAPASVSLDATRPDRVSVTLALPATSTPTPAETATPAASNTPAPTSTPAASATPVPSASPTTASSARPSPVASPTAKPA